MKYIRHREDGFFIFPNSWEHAAMADTLYQGCRDYIASAGQIIQTAEGGMYCVGESLTLNIESREDDTNALRRQLDRLP